MLKNVNETHVDNINAMIFRTRQGQHDGSNKKYLSGGGTPAVEAASKIAQRAAQIAACNFGGGECIFPRRQDKMIF